MRRANNMPPAVTRFQRMGGVPDFVVFEGAHGPDAARMAVALALDHLCGPVDPAAVRGLPCRALTRGAFLGGWVVPGTRLLRYHGSVTLQNGLELRNPGFAHLDAWARAGVNVRSAASECPELWRGGEFAYAFAHPPYGLQAGFGEVQDVFEAVCRLLLPPEEACEILDWAGSDLLALCPGYFEPGTEWWGVFLWTVRVPARGTVAVIAASSTD